VGSDQGAAAFTELTLRPATLIYDPHVRVKLGALVVAVIVAFAAPVGAQVEVGGGGNDRLKGTPGSDDLSGRGGDDKLRGLSGDDLLKGGGGDDDLKGASGRDRLLGGAGSDVLVGGNGRDQHNPGPGEDGINMRNGAEVADPGADVIRARDGSADQISCGDGNDKAFVDFEEEGVYDCETVIEPSEGER
jgi:Ca2+-binding RTX toxin-like protein